jgi:hypothetical protein
MHYAWMDGCLDECWNESDHRYSEATDHQTVSIVFGELHAMVKIMQEGTISEAPNISSTMSIMFGESPMLWEGRKEEDYEGMDECMDECMDELDHRLCHVASSNNLLVFLHIFL